jgi:hypothetical protein
MRRINILSLNLRKAKAATFNAVQSMKATDVMCVQEPYTNANRIPVGNSFSSPQGNPRAGIIVGASLVNDVRLLTNFTVADVCVVHLPQLDLWLASIYCDGKECFPTQIETLALEAAHANKGLVLNLDANAHSSLWGSPDTNRRGEELELSIFRHNLEIINTGDTPTFMNEQGHSSHIDVTLANAKVARRLSDWHVDVATESLSDHRLLRMALDADLGEITAEVGPNVRKANWERFHAQLPPPPFLRRMHRRLTWMLGRRSSKI